MSQEALIGISEAGQILGVSEATLRQWTDEGKIKAFITPGGHRRYSPVELRKFISTTRRTFNIKDLVTELQETVPALRETGRPFLSHAPWYSQLSTESREHLAEMGRNILGLIIRYVAEPSKREDTLNMARDAGRGFGETLAQLGLPLTDAVEAFIRHRDPIMNAATHLMHKREALNQRIVKSIPLVAHVMDEALVALVAAHQQYHNMHPEKLSGGTTG